MKRAILTLVLLGCGGSAPAARPTLEPVAEPLPSVATTQPTAEPAAPPTDPWAGRNDLIQPPAPTAAAPVSLPSVDRFTLPNGLRVVVVANPALPLVTMHLAVGAGAEDEPASKRAVASFTAAMLTHGTNRRSADEISATMDLIGGALASNADLESTHIVCESLTRDLATCLTLVPEIVISPSFPVDEMKVVGAKLAANYAKQREDMQSLAANHLLNLLWGDGNARGMTRGPADIAALERKDLVDWHKAQFVPSNAALVVAGDVDPAKLKVDLGRVFQGWRGGGKAPAAPKTIDPALKGMRIRLVDRPDLPTAYIAIGELGVAHKDKDYLATFLMNEVLGGAISSRLSSAVRTDRGKVYGAQSEFERWRQRGMFVVTGSAPSSETVGTVRILLGELAKMRQTGPTDAELSAAKLALTGNYLSAFQTQRDVASLFLAADLHGLPPGYTADFPVSVSQVTLDDAKEAARKHVDPENLAIVIVGKGDEVAAELDAAGMKFQRVSWLDPVSPKDKKASALGPADPAKTRAGKALLDAALAASGGADKLKSVKSLSATGKVKLRQGTQSVDGDWSRVFVVPDKLRLEVSITSISQDLVTTMAGDAVWQSVNGKAQVFPPELAKQVSKGLWREHDLVLLRHLEPDTIVQATGKETVGKQSFDTVVIKQQNGDNETKLFFDPKTHRLGRVEYAQGATTSVEEYGDYRQVNGLWLPFVQRAGGGGSQQSFAVTVEKYEIDGTVDDATFVAPAK